MKILVFVLLTSILLLPVTAAVCNVPDPGCLSCDDLNKASCNRCQAGHRLTFVNGVGSCALCPFGTGRAADKVARTAKTYCTVTCVDGCQACGSKPEECYACAAGFRYNSAGKVCLPCAPFTGRAADSKMPVADTTCGVACSSPCKFCGSSPQTCLGCVEGYEFDFDTKRCNFCYAGDGSPSDLSPMLESRSCDINCSYGGMYCGGDRDTSLACISGFSYNILSRTCTECPQGYTRPKDTSFRTTSSTCDQKCYGGCQYCRESATDCRMCNAGYWYDDKKKTCNMCPAGTGSDKMLDDTSYSTSCNGKCQSDLCLVCDLSGNNCLGCKAGYKFDLATKTCSPCEVGTGNAGDYQELPTSDTTCSVRCDFNCKFCGASPTECVGCFDGFRLDYETKTCQRCDDLSSKAGDLVPKLYSTWCVSQCLAGCATCDVSNLNQCTSCAAGYRTEFVGGIRYCRACTGGQGIAQETLPNTSDTICNVECDIGCENCSEKFDFCISCTAGYYMSIPGKCALCPRQKGKLRDSYPTFTLPSTTKGQAECSIDCNPRCRTCRGTGANECLNCAGMYYFDGINSCSQCSSSTSYPEKYTFKVPSEGTCNQNCHESCLACKGAGVDGCVRCKQGYYTLGDGICKVCPEGRSKAADATDKTSPSTMETECNIECSPYCKTCSGPGPNQCRSCRAGYQKLNSGDSACQLCTGRKTGEFQEGYSSGSSECRQSCDESCETCDPKQYRYCLMCSASHFMVRPGECQICPANTGKTKDLAPFSASQTPESVCQVPCHKACRNCAGPSDTECTVCNPGYYWKNPGTCVKCLSGTGMEVGYSAFRYSDQSQDSCFACGPGCETCQKEDSRLCLTCKAGFFMASTQECLICPVGKGKPVDDTIPNPETSTGDAQCTATCAKNCLLCSGNSENQCLTCDEGFYVSSTGCKACDAGTGKPADTTQFDAPTTSAAACKITCTQGCDVCSSDASDKCIRCSKGYFMSSMGVCTLCPAGRGKNGDTSDRVVFTDPTAACTTECPSCRVCDGTGACMMCEKGFYYSAVGTCKNCDANTGKPADDKFKTTLETQSSACTSDCHESCYACFGTASNQCLKCNTGYYKSDATTCTMCSKGIGKLEDDMVTPKSGTFDPAKECTIKCDPSANCQTCIGTGVQDCANCAESYFYSNGRCTQCNNGLTKEADTTITMNKVLFMEDVCTVPCHPTCKTCTLDPTYCLQCASNHYWIGPGQCKMCNDGRGACVEVKTFVQPSLESAKCSDCHPTCLGCYNLQQNRCSRCRGGEYLDISGGCLLCPVGKGKGFDPYDVLSPSVDSGQTECTITCHANCQNCFGPGPNECVACKLGFYFSGSGTCTACPLSKTKPADTVSQRTAANPDTVCLPCHHSCLTCSGTSQNNCLSCSGGHYFVGGGTCTPCNAGTGKPSDEGIPLATSQGACTTTCDRRCSVCKGSGPTDCVSCAAGFWWAGNGVCTRCDSKTGKAADTNIQTTPATKDLCDLRCDASCLTCSASDSSTDCVMCSAGHYLSDLKTCRICATGNGKPDDQGFSQRSNSNGEVECSTPCHSSCSTCFDSTAEGCLTCNYGFFMSKLGTCTLCPHGNGKQYDIQVVKVPQTSDACAACHPSCAHCGEPNFEESCLSCNDGFFLSQRGVCSACPSGFGKTADAAVVAVPKSLSDGSSECEIVCHPSCKMCKGPGATDCLNCNQGYFWAGAGVCTGCPSGSGKTDDGKTVMKAALTSLACDIPCHDKCQNCFADTEQSCLSCKAGFFKSTEGVCTRCSGGRGKLADPLGKTPTTTAIAGCILTCSFQCASCTGPSSTDCMTCSDGHYMSASGTCSKCPFGFGKPFDIDPPEVSEDGGRAVCTTNCDKTCSSCGNTNSDTCVGCNQRFFWVSGVCKACPSTTSKLGPDTTGFGAPQTGADCTLKCHPSCQHCTGPAANQCLSCSAGYWRSGETECTKCPNGRGKDADTLYPQGLSTEEDCNIYCDSCSSGCQTCSQDPFECVTCVSDRFLSNDKTCDICSDNCLSCSSKDKCDKCAKNFKFTADGKGCTGDCTVENCIVCAEDPSKCTKCNEEFVLKSATECIKDVGVVTNELSSVAILDSPQLNVDIRSDKLELAFSPSESRNFTSLTLQDKLNGKIYTCAEVSCTYSIKNDKLSIDFNPDFTIVKGKLTIERGSKIMSTKIGKNRRAMQTQSDYPIIVDGISLMKKSPLNTLSFSLRVIVSILRLPLSLLVFWKYPQLAMLMDHMVTHLKIYSLLGHPYMAYVEVVFQSVSDSKVLPFNFDNPFEKWDSSTLDCPGYPAIRSKNLHCSWLDNYGQNFIGLLTIGLIVLILYFGSHRLVKTGEPSSNWQRLCYIVAQNYGWKFITAKLDGNHVEIVLMTIVAYCTADGSSKSVIGIVFGTLTLMLFGGLSLFVTRQSLRVYRTRTSSTPVAAPEQMNADREVRLRVLGDRDSRTNQGNQHSQTNQKSLEKFQITASEFILTAENLPENKWSVYFFAARYVRALLLTIFVTTVRDSVEQVVLVVLLESVYLVVLILFDFRGTKAERLFHTTMHGLMLLHLIIRSVATSESLSEQVIQSQLATVIVAMLLVYIFSHIIVCILVFVGIFLKEEQKPTASQTKKASLKVEYTEAEAFASPAEEKDPTNQAEEKQFDLPVSYHNLDIPEEIQNDHPSQRGIPDETLQQASKMDQIRVRMDLPTQRSPATLAPTNSQ